MRSNMDPIEDKNVATQELPVHLRQAISQPKWTLKPYMVLQLQETHAANINNRGSNQYIETAGLIDCQCSSRGGGDTSVSL